MDIKQLQSYFQKWLFEKSNIYQCLNYSKSFFEADILGVTTSRICTEIEIKTSYSDFKADFNKQAKHFLLEKGHNSSIRNIPNKFYYGCINNLIPLSDIPTYAGLIYCDHGGDIIIVKAAPILHKVKISDQVLFGMLQLNTERNVFGCSHLTYKNRKIKEDFKLKMKGNVL